MTDTNTKLTHIAGTLLIEARAAFLNGAGLAAGEARTTTQHKTFREGKNAVPYVSAQAWRRWLRRTLIEETHWPSSEIRSIAWSKKGTTSKVGGQINPVEYAEDDLFGYMSAAEGQGSRTAREETDPAEDNGDATDDDAGGETIKAVMRASPLATSVLAAIQSDGWQGRDDGFVHVQSADPEALEAAEWLLTFEAHTPPEANKQKEFTDAKKKLKDSIKGKGTQDRLALTRAFAQKFKIEDRLQMSNPQSPLPYSTRFFNTDLEGIFLLDRSRLGVFRNIGDRMELDLAKVKAWEQENAIQMIKDVGSQGKIYALPKSAAAAERCKALVKAIAVLRGGAKQAAFAVDVAPKVLVLAGLTCGNPILNRLFRETDKGTELNVERLREIAKDYRFRLTTSIFIGIRTGYLANEADVRKLGKDENAEGKEIGSTTFVICTPIEAADLMADKIE